MGAPPGCNITARLLVYDVRKQEGSRGWLPIHHVTLSAAKGLSRSAARCFPFAEFTLERSEGLRASAHVLSMTGLDLSVDEELSRSFEPCLNIQSKETPYETPSTLHHRLRHRGPGPRRIALHQT